MTDFCHAGEGFCYEATAYAMGSRVRRVTFKAYGDEEATTRAVKLLGASLKNGTIGIRKV